MGTGRGGEGGEEGRAVTTNGDQEKKNLAISAPTHVRVKILAAKRGETITEVLEDLLGPALDKAEAEQDGGSTGD